MRAAVEDLSDGGEKDAHARGADQQKLLPSNQVDDRHGEQGEDQVGAADDRLTACRAEYLLAPAAAKISFR